MECKDCRGSRATRRKGNEDRWRGPLLTDDRNHSVAYQFASKRMCTPRTHHRITLKCRMGQIAQSQ